MKKHVKVYLDYFDYTGFEFIPCELCGAKSVDIHHIFGRGKDKDVIENLMALCRECHIKAHEVKFTKEYLKDVHIGWIKIG